ncbi:MAG: rhomboid family intramembrane serine protease [Nanoarchaeota archaeon]|nr:rhomboid family intramembrane serine protease [Nanoarchaeota archaeon]MBU2519959.1 rhomboid family intramembrane serine protease [Nanoarchaeota archaeon]
MDPDYKRPKITYALIIINIAIFLLVFSMPEEMMNAVFENFALSSSQMGEVWRWFTSLFLHASASHLFFNMIGLYFFGKVLENEVEKKWYLSIFFVGGLIGSFAFIITSGMPVVGASGCVFALMGAAMLLNPVKRVHFYIFPLPLAFVAIMFALTTTIVIYFQPEMGGVAHIAHFGGLAAGAIFAFFHEPKRAMKGLLVLIICGAVLLILGPVLALITGFGGLMLSVIDTVIGAVLYTIAKLLSFLWI